MSSSLSIDNQLELKRKFRENKRERLDSLNSSLSAIRGVMSGYNDPEYHYVEDTRADIRGVKEELDALDDEIGELEGQATGSENVDRLSDSLDRFAADTDDDTPSVEDLLADDGDDGERDIVSETNARMRSAQVEADDTPVRNPDRVPLSELEAARDPEAIVSALRSERRRLGHFQKFGTSLDKAQVGISERRIDRLEQLLADVNPSKGGKF